jgi:hypothetical protein
MRRHTPTLLRPYHATSWTEIRGVKLTERRIDIELHKASREGAKPGRFVLIPVAALARATRQPAGPGQCSYLAQRCFVAERLVDEERERQS